MSIQGRTLTPEQVALSEERKRKKAEAALLNAASQKAFGGAKILDRRWLSVSNTDDLATNTITVMTWNMLAQCLVRRELFPTSDCLKAQQRQGMLQEELRRSNAHIICLQEVDRLDFLLPFLTSLGYSHTYSCGPRKKHGCLIAYRSQLLEKVTDHTIFYDDIEIRNDGENTASNIGSSFRTRNIGLIVALRRQSTDETVVVATTHLFWHPKYTYERTRQAYILTKSVEDFKLNHNLMQAPSVIAGDFNFTPLDPAYSLLVGDPILPTQATSLASSRVVHVSIDPTIPVADPKKMANDEEDGGEQGEGDDPDRVITNARPASREDGLLECDELEQLFTSLNGKAGGPLRSLYDHWASFDPRRTFGERVPVTRRGKNEPFSTSYTHFWKSTLDYLFVRPGSGLQLQLLSVLEPPSREELDPGLPKKDVCGSDHISLCATIRFKSLP